MRQQIDPHARPVPPQSQEFVVCVLVWWLSICSGGPVLPVIVWLVSPKGSLQRAHGKAATLMWTVLIAVWIPVFVVQFFLADTGRFPVWGFLFGLLLMAVSVVCAVIGTAQARRGMTFLGRAPDEPATTRAA